MCVGGAFSLSQKYIIKIGHKIKIMYLFFFDSRDSLYSR